MSENGPDAHASPSNVALVSVQSVLSRQLDNSPLYSFLFKDYVQLSPDDVTSGNVTLTMTVAPHHVNSSGSLHGGVSAALVDFMGGLAIASTGREKTGASIDIHVTYQSGAKVGQELKVTSQCEKVGRNIAFTTIQIRKRDASTGDWVLVASGSHTKSVTQ